MLAGEYIRLERLRIADAPELADAIGVPAVFSGGWGGGPAGYREDRSELVAFIEGYLNWTTGYVFGARIQSGPHEGDLVGTSTLGEIDLPRATAHIGWTAWSPRVWGSQVNAEAKLLMLGYAFENGLGRIRLQADVRNERSRAAILGIGAVFEGIARRDLRRADGTWRDTALYSVIVDDWSDVRAGLERRLAAFGHAPVEYRDVP